MASHIPLSPLSTLAALGLALALAACGPVEEEPSCLPPEAFEGPERTDFPTDGVGTEVGDTLANHVFRTSEDEPFPIESLYAQPGYGLIMLVTASGWCTACIEEQPKLQALHDELSCRGLSMMVAVFQDEQFAPARPFDAQRWQERFDLTFPVVADPQFQLGAYYDASQTPMVMMVHAETMEILSIETGYNEATIRAIVNAYL